MDQNLRSEVFAASIKRTSTTSMIADKLAFMIESGLLNVGDHLPSERDLAATFGVARMTVRHAIHMLAAKGLVEMSQGARTRIVRQEGLGAASEMILSVNLAAHDLRSAYATRRIIEREIMQELARTITSKTLSRLKDLVNTQRSLFDDVASFQISDREFHETIYRASNNQVLSELALGLYAYGLGFRRKAMSMPGAVARSQADHELIVAALESGDPQDAALRADEHLANILNTTSDAMSRR
ncbi:FadR/GntR family transcriptional regulator [Brucella intermedia]|uniref:FadR/GntR family transcriptional regulator n=1 Tax=Brucella intermedia TaxID=94625 RepID=UPI00224A97F8|nr:FCD domain-containing protein [Brucella intermedia]